MRNGLPSTLPTSRTDSCFEMGNHGLVMLVGLENFGKLRSSRALSGATLRPSTTGCGIGFPASCPKAVAVAKMASASADAAIRDLFCLIMAVSSD